MKKKIFITGGGGMLASEIENFYSKKGDEVFAPTHTELDILNQNELKDSMSFFKPDFVFHAAALHVEACEDNPELAFKLNSWSTGNLARISAEFNATFVYISSCGYFGDEIKYYSEYDPVVLKTVYAHSKYQGEVLALGECKKTFAIRPGWLFGGSIRHKKNFVYQRYLEGKKNSIIKSANDKYGCPTYIGDLTEKIDEIIATEIPGIYHVTNSGGCSRFEYVKKIIDSCGLKTDISPVSSDDFPRKAKVPDCELLNNFNLKKSGLALLPPWQEAIECYSKEMLRELKK